MSNMLEPKYKHAVVNCNSKIYVLGGYSDTSLSVKSHSVYKYDKDLDRWFVCNPMRYGRADFNCISSAFSTNIYVFGGISNDEQSRVVEKYDSILDMWISLTFKVPNPLLFTA